MSLSPLTGPTRRRVSASYLGGTPDVTTYAIPPARTAATRSKPPPCWPRRERRLVRAPLSRCPDRVSTAWFNEHSLGLLAMRGSSSPVGSSGAPGGTKLRRDERGSTRTIYRQAVMLAAGKPLLRAQGGCRGRLPSVRRARRLPLLPAFRPYRPRRCRSGRSRRPSHRPPRLRSWDDDSVGTLLGFLVVYWALASCLLVRRPAGEGDEEGEPVIPPGPAGLPRGCVVPVGLSISRRDALPASSPARSNASASCAARPASSDVFGPADFSSDPGRVGGRAANVAAAASV